MKNILVILPFIIVTASSQKCPSAASLCRNPAKDVKDLIQCQVSSAFSNLGLDTMVSKTGTLICNGKSTEQIGKEFKGIVTSAASGMTLLKITSVISQYMNCLKSKGSTVERVLSTSSDALRREFDSEFKAIMKSMNSIKGSCPAGKVRESLYSTVCPFMTVKNGKRMYAAVRKAVGKDVFKCGIDHLDPQILLMKQYT